ncbi:MAG: solute symporter family protein [Hyphomicrobium sp.]
MALTARARIVNPRLGPYFSIFAALFAAVFLLALIFEQLQFDAAWLRFAAFAAPLVIYAAIGVAAATQDTLGFFAAGRRVPAAYSGIVLAVSTLGGTFLVAGCGAFFFAGFDALVLMFGAVTGMVVMAIALAPFYRKFGAYTLPSYLGRRFDSKALRIAAAVASAVAMLLVLAAELRIGAAVGSRLIDIDPNVLTLLLAAFIAIAVAPGGKRSFTWVAVAQSIAMLFALLTIATLVSVIVTSLPVPQLANGPLVRGLVRNEVSQGLPLVSVWPLAFGLPGDGFQTLTKPYVQPFGAVGALAFIIGTMTIAAGIAAAPWLLPRVAGAPGVYEARKSLGWATVFAGFIMLTLSSVAVFMRDFALDVVMSDRVGPLPQWLYVAAANGVVAFDQAAARLDFTQLQFHRDAILFGAPIAAGAPMAFSYLMMAGALAAALAAASATAVSLASVLGEDVVQGLSWEPASRDNRVWLTRAFVGVAALSGASLTVMAPTDPLRLVLWALSLTAASLFPVLILSIWWKRLTLTGAMLGLVGGFAVAALAIFAGEAGMIPLPSLIAGSLGIPASAGLAIAGSALRPEASRHGLEIVRDIRVPGGEIIYDREMQRLQLKKHARS